MSLTSNINRDPGQLAIVHTDAMPWQPSPSPTVWRKRLEHVGAIEDGRVTSVVRFDAQSRFPVHGHPEGEEILVLDGIYADEQGIYPKGSYLLNPVGFEHAPYSDPGCVLFVKLRQYPGPGRRHVFVDSARASWRQHPVAGVTELLLYQEPEHPESVRLVRVAAHAQVPYTPFPRGEEIFVLEGSFSDEHGSYRQGSWVRYPAGSGHIPTTHTGCLLYVKKGHL